MRKRGVMLVMLGMLVVSAGCRQLLGFEDVVEDDLPLQDATVDTLIPDAGACVAVSAACVSDSVLRVCSEPGGQATDVSCAWGCLSAPARCGQLVPSGGAVTAADVLPDPALEAKQITVAGAQFDSDTGAILGLRSAGVGVKDGIDFVVRNGVGIFRFKSLLVEGTALMRGSNAIALVADGDISLSGVLDARGTCIGSATGPGGRLGGATTSDGAGVGGGESGNGGNTSASGAGGGGHGAMGAVGGKGDSNSPGAGGAVNGDALISSLAAAGGGGGGGGSSTNGGAGGAGGGAIQIVSNGRVSATAGGINAGGCGGSRSSAVNNGGSGGGGGAGGTILIEAVVVDGENGGLAVNGGGGGGASGGTANGTDGANASLSATAASGGAGAGEGAAGGAGGASTAAAPGATNNQGGGGGGGVGRIRINTRDGTVVVGNGFTSPALTATPTTATMGVATVN